MLFPFGRCVPKGTSRFVTASDVVQDAHEVSFGALPGVVCCGLGVGRAGLAARSFEELLTGEHNAGLYFPVCVDECPRWQAGEPLVSSRAEEHQRLFLPVGGGEQARVLPEHGEDSRAPLESGLIVLDSGGGEACRCQEFGWGQISDAGGSL